MVTFSSIMLKWPFLLFCLEVNKLKKNIAMPEKEDYFFLLDLINRKLIQHVHWENTQLYVQIYVVSELLRPHKKQRRVFFFIHD